MAQQAPAWLQPPCFWAGIPGSTGRHCGRALCLSLLGTAQELPGAFVCEDGAGRDPLCCQDCMTLSSAAPGQASTFPGWGCAFLPPGCWLTACAKAAGRGGQGTQLQCRIWSVCGGDHLCGATGPRCSEQAECKGVKEWTEEPPRSLGFPPSPLPGCWGE